MATLAHLIQTHGANLMEEVASSIRENCGCAMCSSALNMAKKIRYQMQGCEDPLDLACDLRHPMSELYALIGQGECTCEKCCDARTRVEDVSFMLDVPLNVDVEANRTQGIVDEHGVMVERQTASYRAALDRRDRGLEVVLPTRLRDKLKELAINV